MNRREFIVVSSTAAAGFAAIAAGSPIGKAPQAADVSFVSVGFWGGASKLARRFAAIAPALQAADRLTTSDPSLLQNGARFGIRGFYAAGGGPRPRAVSVSVAYPGDPGEEKPAYFAWASTVGATRVDSSSPVEFNVPVPAGQSIDVIIDRSIGGVTQRTVVPLAINPGAGALRLNRGVYVFAVLTDAGQATPSWGTVRVRDEVSAASIDPKGSGLIASDALFGAEEVSFDYFVLTVADATESMSSSGGRSSRVDREGMERP